MRTPTRRLLSFTVPVLAAAAGSLSFADAAAGTPREARWYDQYMNRSSVPVRGTMWDFYKKNKREMDPDFDDKGPKAPKGHYIDIMSHTLDADGKPKFSGGGYFVETTWVNAAKQPIIWPKSYIATRAGDGPGSSPKKAAKIKDDCVDMDESVDNWFRDDDYANETYDAPVTFTKGASGFYVFDSEITKGKKKARPKKGQDDTFDLLASGKYKKKRYTFEADTTFIYEAGTNWTFTVKAQDDVWVYINNKLVIDLGGAYKGKEKRDFGTQTIELDRLGLEDGKSYSLKVFMADRDKGSHKSHLRMETNIPTLNLVNPSTASVNAD